jgi:hypothetical protein
MTQILKNGKQKVEKVKKARNSRPLAARFPHPALAGEVGVSGRGP